MIGELEAYEMAVSCIIPGGVDDTNFALASNMIDSPPQKFSIGRLTAEVVTEPSVNTMFKGRHEMVVDLMYAIQVLVLAYT